MNEETHCHACKVEFEKNELGKPLHGWARSNGHYVRLCGPCLTDRKRDMGFYRNGHYVGPEGCKDLFAPFIPPTPRPLARNFVDPWTGESTVVVGHRSTT